MHFPYERIAHKLQDTFVDAPHLLDSATLPVYTLRDNRRKPV